MLLFSELLLSANVALEISRQVLCDLDLASSLFQGKAPFPLPSNDKPPPPPAIEINIGHIDDQPETKIGARWVRGTQRAVVCRSRKAPIYEGETPQNGGHFVLFIWLFVDMDYCFWSGGASLGLLGPEHPPPP